MNAGTATAADPLERYWLPAGESYSLTPEGWLNDPAASNWLFQSNIHAVRTVDLATHTCLVLLGEPGMGKSTSLRVEGPWIPEAYSSETLRFDLGAYSSEDRLARRVFENETIKGWLGGSGTLCLVLDSFDEGHNRIPNLHALLAEYLDEWDCSRLFLRIACRTADWPISLQNTLDEQFGSANIHELLPLRRTDAATLLRSSGVAATPFIEAVESAHVVPLAARPLTLNLLMAATRVDGLLPQRATELYERGLLTLADELNPSRRDAEVFSSSASDRLKIATRMASISIFGDKPVVWTGPLSQAEKTDLTIDECLPIKLADREWSSDDVEATLRTGIFTGNGENRLGWSHATFAHYLCSRWIDFNGLNRLQVQSLLLAPDGKIPTRLRQVAAWLVASNPSKYGWLTSLDPEAFVLSIDIPDAGLRRQLVVGLLDEVRAGRLYYDYALDLSGLKHEGLTAQLRSALIEPNADVARMAVRISRQCEIHELIPDLINLTVSPQLEGRLRIDAGLAVHDLSKGNPTSELAALLSSSALAPADQGTAEELEAVAAMASWPHALTTAEVFALINPQHPRNYRGLYSLFLHDFAERLSSEDLEAACGWLTSDLQRTDDSRLATLVDAIVTLCIDNLHVPVAQQLIKRVALRRADEFPSLFTDESYQDRPDLSTEARRAIALVLFEDATEHQVLGIVHSFGRSEVQLLKDDDLPWLIDSYLTANGQVRENIVRALTQLYSPTNIAHADLVLELPEDHPAAELLAYWRSFVPFDSTEAAAAQEQWRRLAELRTRRQISDRPAADDWVNPRIGEEAAAARAGDFDRFWFAVRLVTIRPGSQYYMNEHEPDLTAHPRWQTLSERTRQDLIEAAPIYLIGGRCHPERWLEQGLRSFPANAAYRAMLILLREHPDELLALPAEVWKEWAPILVGWPTTINGARATDKRLLFEIALPHARAELTAILLELIDRAIATENNVFLGEEISLLDSEYLATQLINRLGQPMAPNPRADLVESLIGNHSNLLRPLLIEWLNDQRRAEDQDRARMAVGRLLTIIDRDGWPVLEALMESDPEFMESAFLSAGHAHDRRPPDIDEAQIASLYIWLSNHFPPQEDPQFEDAHFVGPRESLGNWRDALLDHLRQRGSEESVRAVQHIAAAFPERPWLNYAVIDARRSYRDIGWEPLKASELDSIADSRTSLLVRADSDLHSATLDALTQVQAQLQRDTPSARLLWDTFSERPKSEDEVSDYLAIELGRLLNQQGVIVNREVQVRRNKSSGLPERTDLRVEAAPLDPSDGGAVLRIPGEVKGAWNSGVVDSIRTQLLERYMADFQTDYGVYVVFWFDPSDWAPTDSRRQAAASHGDKQQLLEVLSKEAEKYLLIGKHIAVVLLDASLRRPTT